MAASFLSRMTRFAFIFAAAAGLSACGVNSIPTAEENAKAKWADVQNQYQRRADLIPNLVATVKGYAKQEQDTLTKVTEARARATSVQVSAADVTDPAKMAEFQQAQGQLSAGLGRLLASVEAYPDLKSNQNFLALQSQLEGTENRIAVARRGAGPVAARLVSPVPLADGPGPGCVGVLSVSIHVEVLRLRHVPQPTDGGTGSPPDAAGGSSSGGTWHDRSSHIPAAASASPLPAPTASTGPSPAAAASSDQFGIAHASAPA